MRISRNGFLIAAGILLLFLGGAFFLLDRTLSPLLKGTSELKLASSHILDNPTLARQEFQEASVTLNSVLSTERDSGAATLLTPLPPLRWEVELTKASIHLANAGSEAGLLLSEKSSPATTSDVSEMLTSQSTSYFSWYNAHPDQFAYIQQELTAADSNLGDIPTWIFVGHTHEVTELADTVHEAATGFPKFTAISDAAQNSFGKNDPTGAPHSFLILFQNDAELRPTGGFMGSYAVLTASSGTIRDFTFGEDIYKIDKPFAASAKVSPPDPLKTITQYWGFRDSTVGTGFLSDASPNVAKMYQEETGTPISGIIYLDSTVLEDILRLTGPIALPTDGTTVTASTINSTLTEEVEETYFQDPSNKIVDEPKSIIKDLIPVVLQKIEHTPGALHTLPGVLLGAVERKSIQFWAQDTPLENALASAQPIDGPSGNNWIKIVNTNLGGQKSSRNVEQDVTMTQKTTLDQQLVQTITITRHHTGTGVWPDDNNNNYMDIYIPPDATVLSIPKGNGGQSFLTADIQKEMGTTGVIVQPSVKTTLSWKDVGFWATTNVGKTTTYTLTYSLPLTSDASTHFTYIKQAGAQREYLSAFNYSGLVTGDLSLAR